MLYPDTKALETCRVGHSKQKLWIECSIERPSRRNTVAGDTRGPDTSTAKGSSWKNYGIQWTGQVLVQSVEGRMMRRCDPKIVLLWVNSEHDHDLDNLIFTTEISKDRPPLWRFG